VQIFNAVLVEIAISSCERCKDFRITATIGNRDHFADQLRGIFHVVDADGSGWISNSELAESLRGERLHLQMCLEALDLDASDADTLFILLD
jgi:hypothetical protein